METPPPTGKVEDRQNRKFLRDILGTPNKRKRLSGSPLGTTPNEKHPLDTSMSKRNSTFKTTPPWLDKRIPASASLARINALSEATLYQHVAARSTFASTPFEDSTVSVAVDVSTSTRGLVLSQEALAISTICHQLSKEARKKGHVLPWSNTAHPVVRLMDSAHLRPSFGTDPSVLWSDDDHATALKESDLWFLMTDGMIHEGDVKRFAKGVARNGLHGTTCVIILFGYLPTMPAQLNTSVGISLFAVAPNCLFLFHDVESGTIYVLQHKGCFTANFEGAWSDNPSLDYTDTWESLPQTTYEQVAMLHIPKPAKLDEDDVALAGNKIISISDLYQGRLDSQTVSQIFNKDDSMKTVLLTAATRGKSAEVEAWLAKQRMTGGDYFTTPRPDIHQEAFLHSKKLISLMKTKHNQADKAFMQSRLRNAHAKNWKNLQASIEHRLAETETHNIIVRDSIDRINLTRRKSLSSPSILSPVSSSKTRSASTEQPQRHNQPTPYQLALPTNYDRPPEATGQYASAPPYLYTPSYRRKVGYYPEPDVRGDCCLCGVSTSPVALLLKKPDPNLQTEGLPPPGSQARLTFPLAMGNFPETDIISNFVCCDPCSYFIALIGEAPPNEIIVGAVILTNFDENRHLWKSALDTAFEQRFAKEDHELLFLAILYTTLQDVDSESEQPKPTIRQALSWAISQLQRTVQVPMSLSESLAAPGIEVIHSQFFTVLENSFLEVSMPKPPILRYPIEGFAILVRAVQNMKSLEQRDIDKAVFERFLFHLTEQFIALRMAGSPTNPASLNKLSGSKLLANFLPTNTKIPVQNRQKDQRTIPTPVTVSSLCRGPLLSEDALAIFQTMTPSFPKLEGSSAWIIGKFVGEMVQVPEETNDPVEVFDVIRKGLDMQSMTQSLAWMTT
ncbi:MAG: hypothetical protein Q9217_000363 [Psora testacea]